MLIMLVGCALSTYYVVCVYADKKSDQSLNVGIAHLSVFVLSSAFMAVISGAGGYIQQPGDWTKHNVIINDLVNYSWPVQYGPSAYVSDTTLVYYLGYYLIPGLVGKYFGGWALAQLATFVYTFIGIFIFTIALYQKVHKSVHAVFIFFALSGIDIIGSILLSRQPLAMAALETYAYGLQIPSLVRQISWAPQHAIPSLLFAYLIYSDIEHKLLRYTFLYYFSICIFWSPFVAASILLISLPNILQSTRLIRWKDAVFQFFPVIFSLVVLLYYKSQIGVLHDQIGLYWITNEPLGFKLINMIVFLIVDILIFFPLIFAIRSKINDEDYRLSCAAICLLCVIAQFRYGTVNDWLLRTSPMLLAFISIVLAKYYRHFFSGTALLRIVFCTIFLLGLVTTFSQIVVLKDVSNPATNERPDRNMLYAHIKYGVIHQQYMGSASRLFGKLVGNYVNQSK